MKTSEFTGKIHFKAIISAAFIALATNHILMTGMRGFGFTNNAEALFSQRFSFFLARLVVMAISFFIAGFVASYVSQSKSNTSGVVNALIAMSLFHLSGNLFIPVLLFPENTAVVNSLFFLSNFFMYIIGIATGVYGSILAVKIDQGEWDFRTRKDLKESRERKDHGHAFAERS